MIESECIIKLSWGRTELNPLMQVHPISDDQASIMLFSTAVQQHFSADNFHEIIELLQQLIDGKWMQAQRPVIHAHASIIKYSMGYFFLYDDLNYERDTPKGVVVKIKPLDLVRYLWHYVLCQIEKTDQIFTIPLEVIPSADLPDPLD